MANHNDICGQPGLCSAAFVRPITFPYGSGLSDPQAGGFGSSTQFLGPIPRTDSLYQQFESIASLAWVKANHTFKFGGELRNGGTYTQNFSKAQFYWSSAQTAMPYLVNYSTLVNTSIGTSTANIGANHIGLPYASFLLGAVGYRQYRPLLRRALWQTSVGILCSGQLEGDAQTNARSWFAIRLFDLLPRTIRPLSQPCIERAEPNRRGYLGAVTYEATCHCSFARNYPWAFGPRLGIAYQVLPKTVLRSGFAIVYTGSGINGANGSAAANAPLGPPPPGQPLMTWGQAVTVNGAPLTLAQIAWPNFDPGFYPIQSLIPGRRSTIPKPEDPPGSINGVSAFSARS